MAKDTRLAIIVPCLNEEALIKSTTNRLLEIMKQLEMKDKISDSSYIYLVDDGSTDNTWYEIGYSIARNPNKIKALKFTRNFGNQKALLAGLTSVNRIGCDVAITIDCDLQQDETKIEEFIDKYEQGAKIVFGIRKDRKTDSFFKKITALAFYKLMNILGVKISTNHSDYRLVSKEALDVLERFKEADIFLRGFFNEIGLKKDKVYFDVKPRKQGKSKYNLFSLMALAAHGITSYSIVPLKLICFLGFIIMIVGFIAGICAMVSKFVFNNTLDGWAEAIILTSTFGGFEVFCIGIMAEYLGQIYREVKKRPRYLVEDELL